MLRVANSHKTVPEILKLRVEHIMLSMDCTRQETTVLLAFLRGGSPHAYVYKYLG